MHTMYMHNMHIMYIHNIHIVCIIYMQVMQVLITYDNKVNTGDPGFHVNIITARRLVSQVGKFP